MIKAIKTNNTFHVLFQASVILFLFLFPITFLYGQSSPNTGITYECVDSAGVFGNCTFDDLVRAVERVIRFAILISIQLSVVVIAYAGYNYMMSGDNPKKRSDANQMLTKVAIGIFFMMAAYLIVTLIARALLTPAVLNVTPVFVP